MSANGCTSDQLLAGIHRALKARDFEGVAALLRILAVQDPHAAQAVLDALSIAQAVSR